MTNILLVPMRLDALLLRSDQQVAEARADFTLLPYSDGERDMNSDTAYISEEIVSQPFQNQNLTLKRGIHLHWALPDTLTNGRQTPSGMVFPIVPNRWLVIRSKNSSSPGQTIEKQWVVESDYLYPDGAGALSGSVNIPCTPDESGRRFQPFRFLGRSLPRDAWHGDDQEAEYLSRLTAVGYGEPTFAAFYPNCHSVFGFYDDDYSDNLPEGLQYDVLGWYGNAGNDHLRNFIREHFPTTRDHPPPATQDYIDAVKASLGWDVSLDATKQFPDQMLCYARLTFSPSGRSTANPVLSDRNTSITVANTGVEALAACLAARKDPSLKASIEDQLEALLLRSLVENRQLDVGPKFQEARHENGFRAIPAGALWTLTLDARISEALNDDTANQQAEIIAHQLSAINTLQQAYDSALDEIESMREQLFSDWYKYMICSYPAEDSRDDYPNLDEIKYYLDRKGVIPLDRKTAATGILTLPADQSGPLTSPEASGLPLESLAAQLADAINQLVKAIQAYNDLGSVKHAGAGYTLRSVECPRYYQPTNPVVLITGPAVNPTKRHGQDGLLACQVLSSENTQGLVPEIVSTVLEHIDRISETAAPDSLAFNKWTTQPWNPFLLEWEVEVFPTDSLGNIGEVHRDYDPRFIGSNYTILENDVDLSLQPGKGAITAAANVYAGYSILTSYASDNLKEHIEAFLEQQLLADYYKAKEVPEADRTTKYFGANITKIIDWYKQANSNQRSNDPTRNMIDAYEVITAPEFHSLSQSLGGFNDGLLMHKQTLQLPIGDPLGFVEYREFAQRVREAVKEATRIAPLPSNDFNPIRSGALKVTRLRLVDTFGQGIDLDCSQVSTNARQTIPSNPYLLALPPRLVQPSRINFRWRSATRGEHESNNQPAASPICGWLLVNNLDGSLMIYDGQGKALGLIDENAKWEAAPGDETPIRKESIPNPYLRNAVNYVCNLGRAFVEDFILTIDNALENIEPENYAHHTDLALLMGRPLALVRASVNLELQGLPAIHQAWNSFRQDLRRNTRDTDRFDEVLFPIRIGEYRQFNDGLVGYWLESDGGVENSFFYAPQSAGISDRNIKTHADDPMTVWQTVESAPKTLMMLMDPRGSVHATCGILPSKSISLPPDQYAAALRKIEITFLTAPILTDMGKINLPLPVESGYQWSWLQKEKKGWREVSTAGTLKKQVFLDTFENGQRVWDLLISNGWIAQIGSTQTARIVAKDQRSSPSLGDLIADQIVAIEDLLASSYIGEVSLRAGSSSRQELREGWLKLSELPNDSSSGK